MAEPPNRHERYPDGEFGGWGGEDPFAVKRRPLFGENAFFGAKILVTLNRRF